ncbi:MAG: hypothetical protein CME74_05370, partial [Halomonas sp.]|nr:hypothetical protein [Halomonas sp.]
MKLRFTLKPAFAALALRVCSLSAAELKPHMLAELREAPKLLFRRVEPFAEIDFELGAITRRTAVVCYAEGTRLFVRARGRALAGAARREERLRLCALAAAQFEEGLTGSAGGQEDPMICVNYASMLEFLERPQHACAMFRRAVRANPRHAHSLLCAAEARRRA